MTDPKGIVIQPALNVTNYYYGRLIVRIHEADIVSGGGTISVVAHGTAPSSEDLIDFVDSTHQFLIQVGDSAEKRDVLTATASDLWPYLKISVWGSQGPSAGPGRLCAVLSADLLLREA
jgi:hypothetical protein